MRFRTRDRGDAFKKLAVLGAGAIGYIIGANVTRAGRAITLITMRPAHVAQTRAHGLKVPAAEAGEFTVVPRNNSVPSFSCN